MEATKVFNIFESHTHSPPRALTIEDSFTSVLILNMIMYMEISGAVKHTFDFSQLGFQTHS